MGENSSVRERAILFSAPMVLAILAGRKTQTRRLVKLPRSMAGGDLSGGHPDLLMGVTPGLHVPMPDDRSERLRNPWGWPEPSRLWVRETWAPVNPDEPKGRGTEVVYRADLPNLAEELAVKRLAPGARRWHPSIFMPRWASRITLEVTGVRVERLRDLSEADAVAEGARHFPDLPSTHPYGQDNRWSMGEPTATDECLGSARHAFGNLWESINGFGSWDVNPWVWCLSFQRAQ